MKNKKLFLGVAAATLAMGAAAAVVSSRGMNFKVKADPSFAFTLNASKALTAEDITAGEKTFTTNLGNPLTFAYEGAIVEEGKFASLEGTGSYLEIKNTNMIKGVTSLDLSVTSRHRVAYAVFAGSSSADAEIVYRYSVYGNDSGWHDDNTTVTFDSPVNYVRLENIGRNRLADGGAATSKLWITSLTYNYTCEEASEEAVKEARSKDMLSGIEVSSDRWWNYEQAPIDYECTDSVVGGYSIHSELGSEIDGWPSINYKLGKTYDFSDKGLLVNAKFVDMHPWFSVTFQDASQEDITKSLDFDVTKGSWKSAKKTNAEILSKLKAGRTADDLKSVKYIKLCVNANDNKGENAEFWFDEFHPIEPLAFGQNMENVYVDVGMSSKVNYGISYEQTKGANSYSALKVTFEKADTATADGKTSIPVVISTESDFGTGNPVLNSGTLEFDMKPSLDILNGDCEYKHQVSLTITGSDWQAKNGWVDIGNSWLYIAPNTADGWFHVTANLANYPNIAACTTNNIRISFGFFGVTPTNRNTASVYIDNINYTAA